MVTKEQWLELHKVCLDTVRSAIQGLSKEGLEAKPLPDDDSIGEQANHVIGAESYWLREVHIEPAFRRLEPQGWTEAKFLDGFSKIERQYAQILDEKGLDPDILFGLSRVCQHALYHHARILTLRWALEPDWEPTEPLRWERAVDFVTDLLLVGPEAKPREG